MNIYKVTDVDKAFSNKVRGYLNNGWYFNTKTCRRIFGDYAHFVDLTDGKSAIRVWLERGCCDNEDDIKTMDDFNNKYYRLDYIKLCVGKVDPRFRIGRDSTFYDNIVENVEIMRFWLLGGRSIYDDDAVFVDSKDYAIKAYQTRSKRYAMRLRRFKTTTSSLEMNDNRKEICVSLLKNKYDYKRVNPNNIRLEKTYRTTDGAVKEYTLFYNGKSFRIMTNKGV